MADFETSLTIYELAVTTNRTADMLAKKHGFDGVQDMADFLPSDARVIDEGAGASPLGREVADLRPDITWVNFDYSYHNPAIQKEVVAGAPPNVRHVSGDATKLDHVFSHDMFDVGLSYWMYPHLSLEDSQPARAAAMGLFKVVKQGGLLSVGPKAKRHGLPSMVSGKSVRVTKDESWTAGSYADMIVDATRLRGINPVLQRAANEVATPYFGTSRYTIGEKLNMKVYDPKAGEYIGIASRRAWQIAGELAVLGSRNIRGQIHESRLQKRAARYLLP